jgi:hypothetical protein
MYIVHGFCGQINPYGITGDQISSVWHGEIVLALAIGTLMLP